MTILLLREGASVQNLMFFKEFVMNLLVSAHGFFAQKVN